MQKLYCYVDETGQDTLGELFIVSVIIVEPEREELISQLVEIERVSQKGQRKWMKARQEQRVAYIRGILRLPALKGRLNYALYRHTTEYLSRTVQATAQAITTYAQGEYKAVVFVDGLRKSQTQWFGSELRHLRVRTEKVKGVRSEESDVLMRLADALAGFVRAATIGQSEFVSMLEKGKADGFIREL